MILPDVNVLIYAFREDATNHKSYKKWLENVINSPEPYCLSELVLSSLIRITTNAKIFIKPTPLELALKFTNALKNAPNCILVQPGRNHWALFLDLCHKSKAKGNLIADAYLAALAIDSGCEWITTDRDFSLFKGLKWRHPLK